MKIYRLYTENKNRKTLLQLVSEEFAESTIYDAVGYWQGKPKKTFIIEIASDGAAAMIRIVRLCKAICGYNKQDCVMLQTSNKDVQFIGQSGIWGG